MLMKTMVDHFILFRMERPKGLVRPAPARTQGKGRTAPAGGVQRSPTPGWGGSSANRENTHTLKFFLYVYKFFLKTTLDLAILHLGISSKEIIR